MCVDVRKIGVAVGCGRVRNGASESINPNDSALIDHSSSIVLGMLKLIRFGKE